MAFSLHRKYIGNDRTVSYSFDYLAFIQNGSIMKLVIKGLKLAIGLLLALAPMSKLGVYARIVAS